MSKVDLDVIQAVIRERTVHSGTIPTEIVCNMLRGMIDFSGERLTIENACTGLDHLIETAKRFKRELLAEKAKRVGDKT